jgi:predicted transcriptional regulator
MTSESPPALDVVNALQRRSSLLELLAAEPSDIRDLRDELDLSRSTVYNAVRELESLGIVTQVDGRYRLTTFGRAAFQQYDQFIARFTRLCDVGAELAALLPPIEIPADVFANADIVAAESHAPDRPFDAFERFIGTSDSIRAFAPVTGARYVDLVNDQLRSRGVTADLVTEERVVDYILAHHRAELLDSLAHDGFRFYRTTERLPFGLVLVEEPDPRLGLLLYDERGQFRVFLTTDSEMSLEWGDRTYDSYRTEATRVALDDVRESEPAGKCPSER